MKNLIQTLTKNFVNKWEKDSVASDFCIQFPRLPHFIVYINQNTNLVQRERIFQQANICSVLEAELINELQRRIRQVAVQTRTVDFAA